MDSIQSVAWALTHLWTPQLEEAGGAQLLETNARRAQLLVVFEHRVANDPWVIGYLVASAISLAHRFSVAEDSSAIMVALCSLLWNDEIGQRVFKLYQAWARDSECKAGGEAGFKDAKSLSLNLVTVQGPDRHQLYWEPSVEGQKPTGAAFLLAKHFAEISGAKDLTEASEKTLPNVGVVESGKEPGGKNAERTTVQSTMNPQPTAVTPPICDICGKHLASADVKTIRAAQS